MITKNKDLIAGYVILLTIVGLFYFHFDKIILFADKLGDLISNLL